ncbi:Y-family DNA polymerase [Zavarzinia sp. CC-PAN008]|uniref:Y-family DNA polymerase n=1 Tax=Zavarzinia sp. CC-PAN008 TaxID=3243332 RepID=UPI003F74A47E
MRRFVSIWLPHWPTDRLKTLATMQAPSAAAPEAPLALWRAGAGGQRLSAVNRPALDLGLRRDMLAADALALAPGLALRPADPEGDRRALVRLGRWAIRYSPALALDAAAGEAPDGLLLDMTGGMHLFGGEAALLDDLGRRLARFGLAHRLAIAGSAGAAHALARHGQAARSIVDGDPAAALAPLPVVALRLAPALAHLLGTLGLRTIGTLYPLARAALDRRFGPDLMRQLDRALGHVAEPLPWLVPPPEFLVRQAFAEPLGSDAGVRAAVDRLAQALAEGLEAQGRGARRLDLYLIRADGSSIVLEAGTSRPSRDAAHLARLFAHDLDDVDLGFGLDAMILAARATEALAAAQASLDQAAAEGRALAALVDLLAGRLGPSHVFILAQTGSHVPERSVRAVPILKAAREPAMPEMPARRSPAGAPPPPWSPRDDWGGRPRPLRLLAHPEPVKVMAEVPDAPPSLVQIGGRAVRVVRADGPERIAPEWWQGSAAVADGAEPIADHDRVRDYYRVEDAEGHRYWLFRAGLYDEVPAAPPRWYLHGYFA